MGARAARVMLAGVYSLEPALPLVMHTVITALPARAHFASVPPTVNSWSSGWAWMLMTRAGAVGSERLGAGSGPTSGVPPSDSGLVVMTSDYPPNGVTGRTSPAGAPLPPWSPSAVGTRGPRATARPSRR